MPYLTLARQIQIILGAALLVLSLVLLKRVDAAEDRLTVVQFQLERTQAQLTSVMLEARREPTPDVHRAVLRFEREIMRLDLRIDTVYARHFDERARCYPAE